MGDTFSLFCHGSTPYPGVAPWCSSSSVAELIRERSLPVELEEIVRIAFFRRYLEPRDEDEEGGIGTGGGGSVLVGRVIPSSSASPTGGLGMPDPSSDDGVASSDGEDRDVTN